MAGLMQASERLCAAPLQPQASGRHRGISVDGAGLYH
jgi:hypothetical protein